MSADSKRERAARRAAEVGAKSYTVPGMLMEGAIVDNENGVPDVVPLANIQAVALVPEEGGFRLVQLSLTPSMAEACAVSATEPEVLGIQLAKAQALLEDVARGSAPDGTPRARVCPNCGVAALVRHPDPNKRVDLCTSCNARHAVSA